MRTHTSNSDVLFVYDSVRSGKRAKELCDRLAQQLAPDSKLNFSVWSMSALQLPTLAHAAACEAEHAALLIVAVKGDKTLPPQVRNCLYWCARGVRAADGALVAQLHGIPEVNEELCPAYGCLRQIAHDNGIRFFSEVVELPEDELGFSSGRIATRVGNSGTWLVSEARSASGPRPILKQFLNRSLTKPEK